MKTAQDWNWEHTQICANDPPVHGQLLPTPQMVKFIERVQADALNHAADIANKHRQELFEDGMESDMADMDKKSIFLESMTQERDCIEDAIRSAAKSLNKDSATPVR